MSIKIVFQILVMVLVVVISGCITQGKIKETGIMVSLLETHGQTGYFQNTTIYVDGSVVMQGKINKTFSIDKQELDEIKEKLEDQKMVGTLAEKKFWIAGEGCGRNYLTVYYENFVGMAAWECLINAPQSLVESISIIKNTTIN
ncbi:MAG: hypothetical protein HY363_04555 [Candidatus Aenigmarchaeota archaeon]|nr:hypothetical protein [Candidatus Aenigmarchaeota archaeon]